MERACELAYDNVKSGQGGPFGCVIVRKGECIAEAQNRVVEMCDPTSHAEILALREACKKCQNVRLDDCIVYSSCEPCSMCFSALRWTGIQTIYYNKTREDAALIGFRDDDIYEQIISRQQNLVQIPVRTAQDAFILWNSPTTKKIEY
jgi:tRNA(Arg) A34 adenosine deaminase TadA